MRMFGFFYKDSMILERMKVNKKVLYLSRPNLPAEDCFNHFIGYFYTVVTEPLI